MAKHRTTDRDVALRLQGAGMTLWLLLLGIGTPEAASAAEHPGDDWRAPGIELLGVHVPATGQARERAVQEDWRYGLYALVSGVIIGKRDCVKYRPAQVEAAYQRVVAESVQWIPAARWPVLEAAILAGAADAAIPRRFGDNLVQDWQHFDRKIAFTRRAYQEINVMRARRQAGALERADRPAIGAGFSGPPIVIELLSDSPAERAGLRLGDTVLEIDDHPVASGDGVQVAVLDAHPGHCLRMLVSRHVGMRKLLLAVWPQPHAQVSRGRALARWQGNRMVIADDDGTADAQQGPNRPCE